jgi:hypothetical protein
MGIGEEKEKGKSFHVQWHGQTGSRGLSKDGRESSLRKLKVSGKRQTGDPWILLENLRLIGPIQRMTGHLKSVIARRSMIIHTTLDHEWPLLLFRLIRSAKLRTKSVEDKTPILSVGSLKLGMEIN